MQIALLITAFLQKGKDMTSASRVLIWAMKSNMGNEVKHNIGSNEAELQGTLLLIITQGVALSSGAVDQI